MAIAALVLAGGASERMGSPKALLRVGDDTFLTRTVRTLRRAGLERIVLVTGLHHAPTVEALAAAEVGRGVRVVRNATPGGDQLSSMLCGLDAVDAPDVSAAVVALVDHPFVSVGTVEALIHGFLDTRAPVTRPVCQGRHGHPVVFARETFDALRASPDGGAKAVVRALAARTLSVEVQDEGIWTDIDTPDAYRAALARFGTVDTGVTG